MFERAADLARPGPHAFDASAFDHSSPSTIVFDLEHEAPLCVTHGNATPR
jgi:hypothetical protein